jgi:hypothetical protein
MPAAGRCYPSYEAIAARAGCARSTVAEALKVLEGAGVLTWQHRTTRIRERCADLFGHQGRRWRVIRTSNAYVFRDPQQHTEGPSAYQSENQPETLNQVVLFSNCTTHDTNSPLERALHRLETKLLLRRANPERGTP